MNFIFQLERNFEEHFFSLLNENKKNDFFQNITEEDIEEVNWDFSWLLDILGISLEEAIFEYLHYEMDVYIEVYKDETWSSIPYKVAIWKKDENNLYSGIYIYRLESWHYWINYIVDNEIVESDDISETDKLKQALGENDYNNIEILISEMLIYESYLDTYLSMTKQFEENFSNNTLYIEVEEMDTLIYINSTITITEILA